MSDIVKWVWQRFVGLAKWALAIAKWLFINDPKRSILGALLVIIVAAAVEVYFARTQQYQHLISNTFSSQGEDTPERFKVLEAFVMSSIDPDVGRRINSATLTKAFARPLSAMDSVLRDSLLFRNKNEPGATVAKSLDLVVSTPDYLHGTGAQLPKQALMLTDTLRDGYLFLPFNLLHVSVAESTYQRILALRRSELESPTLDAIAFRDSTIADDISISRRLVPALEELNTAEVVVADSSNHLPVLITRPAQVYYITKNGINRILNNSGPRGKVLYRNMFRPTTFFPARPYFVEAFKRGPGRLQGIGGHPTDSFYVSKPYFDIGGFGVVVTLAKALHYRDHSDAVVAVDLQVTDLRDSLIKKLAAFGAPPREVTCTIGFFGNAPCIYSDERGISHRDKNLENRLNDAMLGADLSTVVGGITDLPLEEASRTDRLLSSWDGGILKSPLDFLFGRATHPIRFAVPIEPPSVTVSPDSAITAHFLTATLNLERFQQITMLIGLGAGVLVTIGLLLAAASWKGEMRRRKIVQTAFEQVHQVLVGAPVPYVRLNIDDLIVDHNDAFDRLINPGSTATPKSLRKVEFATLLASQSASTYREVQRQRLAEEDVKMPYHLTFTRNDGTTVATEVRSGVILHRERNKVPETFGVVVEIPAAQTSANGPHSPVVLSPATHATTSANQVEDTAAVIAPSGAYASLSPPAPHQPSE